MFGKKSFLLDIYTSKYFLASLVVRDIRNRYLGSVLGMLWAFIQPLTTLVIIWFVFQYGFKTLPVSEDVPFALWLVAGMVPWFFIAETMTSSAHSVVEQAQIIKKVVFKAGLLPIVKVSSALVVHLIFIILLGIVAFFHGVTPTWKWFQIFYYLFASICLLTGIAWLTSSIIVFFKDLGQIVAVLVQVGFWATPIFWNISFVPEKYHYIFKLNPVFYIVEGYRNSILSGPNFYDDLNWMIYFWSITLLVMFIGAFVFNKLQEHFSEVL